MRGDEDKIREWGQIKTPEHPGKKSKNQKIIQCCNKMFYYPLLFPQCKKTNHVDVVDDIDDDDGDNNDDYHHGDVDDGDDDDDAH